MVNISDQVDIGSFDNIVTLVVILNSDINVLSRRVSSFRYCCSYHQGIGLTETTAKLLCLFTLARKLKFWLKVKINISYDYKFKLGFFVETPGSIENSFNDVSDVATRSF